MSTVQEVESRQSTIAFWLALVLLPVLAVGVAVLGGTLVPTIGIVTVAASLFLPPKRTIVVVVLAASLAILLFVTQPIDYQSVRLTNVFLASGLAVLASWTIEQRTRNIRELNMTQASVFASVPDGLLVLDLNGSVLQSNEAVERLVPGVQQGHPLHPLLDHHLADGSTCPGGCLLDQPRVSTTTVVEGESIVRDGARIAIEYTAAHVDDHAVVVSLRDVTAAKRAEQERRMLLEASAREGEQRQVLRALGAPAYAQLPAISGLQMDLHSTLGDPAGAAGDLVDVSALPDGRILVMVADALGVGVLPVRDAWRVLNTARAYVEAGIALEDVIPRTADALAADPGHPDVSLMLAILDPRDTTLELIGGGHPPALLIRENGASEWLESACDGIGPTLPVSAAPIARQLTPGDSLVLYTDSVVDSAHDVIEGLSLLRASATALRKRPAQGWARSVIDAVTGADHFSGNATLLLVRLDGSGRRHTTATL